MCKLEEGNILICHTSVLMEVDNREVCKIGKEYTIIYISYKDECFEFCIIDDENTEHNFTSKNYSRWFKELSQVREDKLEKLLNE